MNDDSLISKSSHLMRCKKVKLLIVCLFSITFSNSQVIFGKLSLLTNQPISLEGFSGLKTYPISKTRIDKDGNFQLNYNKSNYGIGYLISTDDKPLLVILSGEDIEIVGEALSYTETLSILEGKENKWFVQYARENTLREQVLSAWSYLHKIYDLDRLFMFHEQPKDEIINEIKRIKIEDSTFLMSLPNDSYVKWFLPTRKLVSNVSVVAQFRPEEISATIRAFRAIDYTDKRLYHSGLFKDAIESHFWLLENSGKTLDTVFVEMQQSIDMMMEGLIKDERKLNEVTDYLFDLLERHSLFQASEYLAIKVLNEVSCTINSDLSKQLETYRAMKMGNTAQDIYFTGDNLAPNYDSKNFPKKLSDLKSKYMIVVFGASWCPKCTEEAPEIAKLYPKWKESDVEVVFVSLDDNKEAYHKFIKYFPFISTCDFKKWDSPIAKDYYIFGTPTMFLLNQNREILLRPKSVKQIDAWIDWYLVGGNKTH